MINVDRKISEIGLDIDKKNNKFLKNVLINASNYGMIQTKKSKNGFHINIELKNPVTIRESLWIRFYLNDDPLRILFDCLRIINDNSNINVLWDDKQKKEINSIINKIEVLSNVS